MLRRSCYSFCPDGASVLIIAGGVLCPLASPRQPSPGRRHRSRSPGSRRMSASIAMRSACRPSPARRAKTSRARSASCTRRIASSRWICSAASRPASCRHSSAPRAMDVDQEMRVHRFRDVAHRALELAEPSYRRVLEAYAAGVNAGLNALAAPPFEYLVLRATPEPWLPEDSMLTVLAMFNTLQGRQAAFEQSHGALRDTLPEPMFRFLSDRRIRVGNPGRRGRRIQRRRSRGRTFLTCVTTSHGATEHRDTATLLLDLRVATDHAECLGSVSPCCHVTKKPSIIGSNNWAVDGAHSRVRRGDRRQRHAPVDRACRSSGIARRWSFPIPPRRPRTSSITGVTLPGHPQPGRRQQRPRRVGIHQHRRRLERPRPHRARSARPRRNT